MSLENRAEWRTTNLFSVAIKARTTTDCRCDERLKPKDDESTCLVYTRLVEELEYLQIETRLIDEKFASVRGECVI